MESIYTSSVDKVPVDYTDATSAYKKHVWIAVAGIASFFAIYLFLTFWFFYSSYRLLGEAFAGGNDSLMSIGVGLASLFLGVFMIKAFFFVQTKYDVQDREIKPSDEPLLFDYLHKLADEIGAPRPHKVYLSNRVNASVFYDLSFLNLFFPSKKNLEIGLGLINVLNLGEFKAVLAHEYGHFAQKSMLVGRWVYIANQIAGSIIARRDALDTFLRGLSSVDFRIAWIGWILSIIVWSIRSLVELIFRVVVLSQRALSREMEFQADLVAVSVTGSDALIHALHKLQAADAGFSNALNTVNEQLGKEKAVQDIYAIQTNAITKTAYILNDEEYGKSPKLPSENPEEHRVFSDRIAQPPKMWATHPPDQEREANAKKRYISGHIDDRSAWVLFQQPEQTRLQLTADLIKTAQIEKTLQPISSDEIIPEHNKQFEKSYFHPKYKGVYLNRFFCEEFKNIDAFYREDISKELATAKVQELYPESLIEDVEDLKTLKDELEQLKAIQDNRLSANSTGIWHRGTQIRRKELPEVISQMDVEVEEARLRIADHDQMCRTVHWRLAQQLGNDWPDYLKGLMSLIHYSEHQINNLNDAHRVLIQVLNIVMADNKVSSSEMAKLTIACNDVHNILHAIHINRQKVVLDVEVQQELDGKKWEDFVEPLQLGRADANNINEWLQVVSGWVEAYISYLSRLRSEALEVLLRSEEKIQKMVKSGQESIAPKASEVGMEYQTMMPGEERPMTLKLNIWDRFISADGLVPALTKFAVAATIVGGTVYMTSTTSQSDITVYNGFAQPIFVDLNGDEILVLPHTAVSESISAEKGYTLSARTQEGKNIESFQPDFHRNSSHYVYNIAGAAGLYEYRTYYGGKVGDYERFHGNQRWMRTKVDYIFEDPPESVTTSGNSTTRDALQALSDMHPATILSAIPEKEDQESIIRTHALWDLESSPYTIQWVSMSAVLEDFSEVIKSRLEKYPYEILASRALMDQGSEAQREAYCQELQEKYTDNAEDPNLFYLVTRCLPDDPVQSQQFIDGAKRWPEHGWLSFAASYGYEQQSDWDSAYKALNQAYGKEAALNDAIAVRIERLTRYLEHKGKKLDRINDEKNQYLAYLRSMENGSNESPGLKAYYLINTGELQKARDLISTNPELRNSILTLTGASDGATDTWVSQALALTADSLDATSLLAYAGLSLRKGKDLTACKRLLETQFSGREVRLPNFIDLLSARNFSAAEKELLKGGAEDQGQLATLAYVAYGKLIPKSWKEKAQYFLMASEKPYIK